MGNLKKNQIIGHITGDMNGHDLFLEEHSKLYENLRNVKIRDLKKPP